MGSDKSKLFTFRPGEKLLEMLDQAKEALGLKPTDVAREAFERGLEKLLDENTKKYDYQSFIDLEKDTRGSLLAIVKKERDGEDLSRAEWHFLAFMVNQAYSTGYHKIEIIERSLLVDNLLAFSAYIKLRNQQYPEMADGERDGYYFGNLGFSFVDRDKTKNDLQAHIAAIVEGLPDEPSVGSGSFPTRNLDVALRDDRPIDAGKLNSVLRPYLHSMVLVALRGYWYKKEKPIYTMDDWRDDRRQMGAEDYTSSYIHFPHISNEYFRFDSIAEQTTISGAVDVASRRLVFALNNFVEITDFYALLNRVGSGRKQHATIPGFTLDCVDFSKEKHNPDYILGTGRWRHFFNQAEIDGLRQLLHDFLNTLEVKEHLKKLEMIYGRI